MAHITAKKHQAKLADDLCKKTHFSNPEVESLLRMFKKYIPGSANQSHTHHSSRMDRTKFRDVLHNSFDMTDDMLMDRIFRAFDSDSDGYVNMEEWVQGLSVFLRGTLDQQIQFCFSVFDLNQDGFISRDEMFQLLKNSLIKQPTEEDPDEGIKDLVEITLKKMDLDHDGRLSYGDYAEAVRNEPLLLEAFGPCLPSSWAKIAFLATFSEDN